MARKYNFHKIEHDELLMNLADSLDGSRIVMTDIPPGSSWLSHRGYIDVISFAPHYRKPDICVYEIKVSRADLFRDIKSEKWRKYQPHCHRMVFAFPYGMATLDEIPPECGIITYNHDKKSWHNARHGIVNKDPQFDLEMLMGMLLSYDTRMKKERNKVECAKFWIENEAGKRLILTEKLFGTLVCNALRNHDDLINENKLLKKKLEAFYDKENEAWENDRLVEKYIKERGVGTNKLREK